MKLTNAKLYFENLSLLNKLHFFIIEKVIQIIILLLFIILGGENVHFKKKYLSAVLGKHRL